MPVVEMTSGNMGAGLAIVCAQFGNPFYAVMSRGNSPARRKMMEALGAKVVLVDQVDGEPGKFTEEDIKHASKEAVEMSHVVSGFYVDQFNNLSSRTAHYNHTGPEIYQEFGDDLSAFVAAVGSGGTFLGTSMYLKEKNPDIICAAVEPEGCEVLAGKEIVSSKHLMQGIGYGKIVKESLLWHDRYADRYLAVSSEEAAHYKELLASKEGIHVGYSAAANVCAAIKLRESGVEGKICTILCDTGFKY
jgi:cysteine synthase A